MYCLRQKFAFGDACPGNALLISGLGAAMPPWHTYGMPEDMGSEGWGLSVICASRFELRTLCGLARIVRGCVCHAASQPVVKTPPVQGFAAGRSSRSTRSSQMDLGCGLRALLLFMAPGRRGLLSSRRSGCDGIWVRDRQVCSCRWSSVTLHSRFFLKVSENCVILWNK